MTLGLRRWLWLGVGALILGLIIYNLSRSAEWRAFRWDRFWATLLHARREALLAALAATLSSYVVRAYRWKVFLVPIKKASLWTCFAGQILGFSSIYLIGRPGEFVRPAYIARKEKVPITSMVAVLVLERLYDAVALVALFSAALYLAPIAPRGAGAHSVLETMHRAGTLMLVTTVLIVAALAAFRLHAARMTAWTLRALRFLPARALHALEHFLRSFALGLGVIKTWRVFLSSVLSTVLLWGLNGSVFWLVFQSLGGGLEGLSWLAAAMAMFGAVMGLAIQFPGVGGGYQVGMILALTEIYSVGVEASTGASLVTWILISVPCLAVGLGILVHEGLTLRKLEAMAEEERAAVVEEG